MASSQTRVALRVNQGMFYSLQPSLPHSCSLVDSVLQHAKHEELTGVFTIQLGLRQHIPQENRSLRTDIATHLQNRYQKNLLKHLDYHAANLKPPKTQNVNITRPKTGTHLHLNDLGFQKWQIAPKWVISRFKEQNTRSHSKFRGDQQRH